MTEAFEIIGTAVESGVLITADHASNHVPAEIDLGIPEDWLGDHIAYDIGTAAIARLLTEKRGCTGLLGGVSRLVVDYNRDPDDAVLIPVESDGVAIPGNVIDDEERVRRIAHYHEPYHDVLSGMVGRLRPALILSLHSFTPELRSRPVDRPWDIGVLYNRYEHASKLAIAYLRETEGLHVGDQEPYSGKELNATMDRHAELLHKPYFGVEIRQDLIADEAGQQRFAAILDRCLTAVLSGLA